MKILNLAASLAILTSGMAEAAVLCGGVHLDKVTYTVVSRDKHKSILNNLMQKHKEGEYGPRVKTDGSRETPDPERPFPIVLPNGQKKFLIGLSGQNIILVDSLAEYARGGLETVHKIELYNENGYRYGGEVDPKTGKEIGYALDSSTWDVALVRVDLPNGKFRYKVLAGAMGNDATGKPLLIAGLHSRRRVIFDAEFKEQPAGSRNYVLVATNPKSPLTAVQPTEGNWVQKDANGKVVFHHGYGGGPITMPNGELFKDERGWVPFIHEIVWEQRLVPDPTQKDGVRKTPYRTVIAVTYMDPTLNTVMEATKPIFDVYKPNGEMWAAANRPYWGPLVEGGHIEVQFNGKALQSMAQVDLLRRNGRQVDFQMLFSAGEYYSYYGSFLAYSKGSLEQFKPVLNSKGELDDFTESLKPFFTWLGRPVSFHDENGVEYVSVHGVPRSTVPANILLDRKLEKDSDWQHFKRRVIVFPVDRTNENGVSKIRIKDNTGFLDLLKKAL
jgi:hypothetical protein